MISSKKSNCTVRIPIDSDNKLDGIVEIEKNLHKMGISFDTGFDFTTGNREWLFDYSLEGAECDGTPIRKRTFSGKWYFHEEAFSDPQTAKDACKEQRQNGNLCRVVPYQFQIGEMNLSVWDVYIRPKKP